METNSKIAELLQTDLPGLMTRTYAAYESACMYHGVPDSRKIDPQQWAAFTPDSIFDRFKGFTLLQYLAAFEQGVKDQDIPVRADFPNLTMRIIAEQVKKFIHTIPPPERPQLAEKNPTPEENKRKAEEEQGRKIMAEGTAAERLDYMLPGLKAAANLGALFQFSGPIWADAALNVELFQRAKETGGEEWFSKMGTEIAATWYEEARIQFKKTHEWLRSYGSVPQCRNALKKEYPGTKHAPKFTQLPAAEAMIRMECVKKIKIKANAVNANELSRAE